MIGLSSNVSYKTFIEICELMSNLLIMDSFVLNVYGDCTVMMTPAFFVQTRNFRKFPARSLESGCLNSCFSMYFGILL